jgi:hypothetical protein
MNYYHKKDSILPLIGHVCALIQRENRQAKGKTETKGRIQKGKENYLLRLNKAERREPTKLFQYIEI